MDKQPIIALVRRFLPAVLLTAVYSLQAAQPFTVTDVPGGFTVSWDLDGIDPDTVSVSGTDYSLFSFSGCTYTVTPGAPRLPVLAGRYATAGTEADVSWVLEDGTAQEAACLRVMPNPYRDVPAGTDADPGYIYREDRAVYGRAGLYPERAVSWETVTAGGSALLYRIYPVRYDPVSGRTEIIRQGTVRFTLHLPRFRTAALPDSAMDWYDAAAWVKIPISAPGMYRVTYAQLAAAGILPDSGALDLVGIYERGREIPVHITGSTDGRFDPSDHILFYGEVDYDTTVLCDHYTDTTVYWLKSGGSITGSRMGQRPSAAGGLPVSLTEELQHHEKDSLVYSNRNDAVTTLRYYWCRLAGYDRQTAEIPFDLSDPAGSDSVLLTVRLRGYTSITGVDPDHHLTFTLNGTTLPDFYDKGDGNFLYSAMAAPDVLVPGENILIIHLPGDTGAGALDVIYLDWFRLRASRLTTAYYDRCAVRAAADADSAVRRFSIDSLRSPAAVVYRRDEGVLLTGASVVSSGAGTFRAEFADTVAGDTGTWLVYGESAVETVAALVPDTLSGLRQAARQAEYIIITAPELTGEAERLAAWRRQYNGYDAEVVLFGDITDEFNYGVFNPEAIRTYLKYGWDTWPVRPRYVCILGDASWDYKRAEYSQVNVVPAVGNPADDNFSACVSGDDILPDIYIGRLPAADPAEARQAVDKIIAYEADSAGGAWRGSFVFLNGGQNAQERSSFSANTANIIRTCLDGSGYYTATTVIDKQLDDCVWDENRDTILSAVNRGAVWLNFAGHGGSWTWDCMFSHNNIAGLTNSAMLPFITSMTCHTGRFAEPGLECFGESFLEDGPTGGVAFFGTTGWGYILGDYYLSRYLFGAVMQKGYTDLGRAVADAKVSLYAGFGNTYRELVSYYSLIGDPALRIKIPGTPDMTLRQQSFAFSPETPFEETEVQLSFVPQNYGAVCSCTVLVDIYYDMPGIPEYRIASVAVPPGSLGSVHTVAWTPPADRGSFEVYIVLDEEDAVAEWDEENNRFSRSLAIYSDPLVNVRPFDKAVVREAAPELAAVSAVWSADTLEYFFVLDTVPGCSSAAAVSSGPVRTADNTARFRPGTLEQGQDYYWRTRLYNGVQYSPWSAPFSFVLDTLTSGYRWYESRYGQFLSDSTGSGVVPADTGIGLARQTDSVDCAHLDEGASVPMVTSKTSHTDARNMIGGQFDTRVPSEADNFIFGVQDSMQLAVVDLGQVRQIRQVASRHYGGKGDREVWSYFSIATSTDSQEFTTWGEVGPFSSPDNNIADSVGFVSDEDVPVRYMMFNYGLNSPDYGGAGSRIVEAYAYQGRYAAGGELYSSTIGPAAAWDGMSISALSGSSGTVTADIQGYAAGTGIWETLSGYTGVAPGSTVTLDGIDAAVYPRLRLAGRLGTADRFRSPLLQSWEVGFTPVAEYIIESFTVSAGSLKTGDTVRIAWRVRNAGYGSADSCRITVAGTGSGMDPVTLYAAGDTGVSAGSLAWVPDSAGAWMFTLAVNGDSSLPELHYGNNAASLPVTVHPVSGLFHTENGVFVPPAVRVLGQPGRGQVLFLVTGQQHAPVRLELFDAGGDIAYSRNIVPGGQVLWTGARDDGTPCGPGVYYARVSGKTGSSIVPFTLMR